MSVQTRKNIERLLVRASMERGRVHWGKIFAYSPEYLGAKEQQEITKLADRWGVGGGPGKAV
ncbi:MAG: hypothetical protein R6U51_08105 [Anaerolineales bacterium]